MRVHLKGWGAIQTCNPFKVNMRTHRGDIFTVQVRGILTLLRHGVILLLTVSKGFWMAMKNPEESK